MHDALLVPDHDWEKMGEAITTLLREEKLANELAANAQKTVLENLDWQILARKVEAIYAMLVRRRGRAVKSSG
jgi:glycosyltransferase involved in cell wall biosynthesis